MDNIANGMAIFSLDTETGFRYFVVMHKETAVRHYGTQQKLAEALGCRQSTVASWPEVVPLGRAFIIEKLTRGKVKVDLSLYAEASPLRQVQQ